MLNKEESKEEILELYKIFKSSDILAEKLQEKYGLYDTSISSLSRKIRKWLEYYRKEDNIILTKKNKSPAKILIFDIETSPIKGYLWSKWQNGINDEDIIQDWSILCFSAKWLFEDEIMSFKLTKKELKTLDDSRIVKELWKLLDESDIVIGHNGKRFDIKKSNAKFLKYNLLLPSSYLVIDTLLHARNKFAITSNKLDYLGEYLGVGKKISTPKGMWRKVVEGDYDMLLKMAEYCDGDVRLLENVYLTMRPYIQPHPNIGIYIEDNVEACTCCGSQNIADTGKSYVTTVNSYNLLRCNDCGSLMRSRISNLTIGKRKKIFSSVPQ